MKLKRIGILLIALSTGILACNQNSKNTNQMNNKKTTKDLTKDSPLMESLEQYIENIPSDFETISVERKKQLEEVAAYVREKADANRSVQMTYICTHNSRRSHMSQIWAQTAAHYYQIPRVQCYSGGTEATAFNPRAVKALQEAGFDIQKADDATNPVYHVTYSKDAKPLTCFSKKFAHEFNPQKDFAAIMTCSHADEACPFVPGAEVRFSIPYEDPKVADNTPEEEAKYRERCRQIATEMFYLFSKV